jgi:hypothetical protein
MIEPVDVEIKILDMDFQAMDNQAVTTESLVMDVEIRCLHLEHQSKYIESKHINVEYDW